MRSAKLKFRIIQIWALAYTKGYEIAIQAGEEAIPAFEKHKDWRSLATLSNNLAMIRNRFGAPDKAMVLLDTAKEMYLRLGDEGEVYLTGNAIDRALILNEMGQYQAAIKVGEEAINLATHFRQLALIARTQHNLGLIYYKLGQYNQSLLFFDQAKETWLHDQPSPETVQNRLTAPHCLLHLRRFKEYSKNVRMPDDWLNNMI